VPRVGPVILAANHTAGIDPLLIFATCTHRTISFLVATEYCRGLAGWFGRLVGCIPVDRERPGKDSIAACLRLLEGGGCLGIFPQGTFEAPDREPLDAKGGVGLLALRTGATVIPCHISGTQYSDHVFGSFLNRHRVCVRYGPPVELAALRGPERPPDAAQQASDAVMQAIRALAPEDQDHGH
jgi:1-acyl-sn-glycerol-3-phosphate acyltransferase